MLIPPAIVAALPPAPIASVTRQTLASGVHLLVAPRPDARLVAIEVRVRGAGSAGESPTENGLSHALEHMIFKGGDGDAPGAFDAAFERMGGEVVAQTDRVSTAYRVTV
ncbi:MAG: insulinase family protein, partial [Armatimonadetes bacterium]|nr:insulinase family protein [Armatimonadota bacterium]